VDRELQCPLCERTFAAGAARCPHDGTALIKLIPLSTDPLVGRDLDGRFTLETRIGRGGMGAVYRAWQRSVGRPVAVKVIHSRGDDATARRFLREVRLTSRITHPNSVNVVDFGQTGDGMLYLAMELLEGRTLDQVLIQEGPFSPARLVRVGAQLCDALEAAHRHGIVHRDLKPSNIMLLDGGRDAVKVLDFGLAKALGDEAITRAGTVLGTPIYLSPEVALGRAAEPRSDLYSLGVILYQLAAGRPPFAGGKVRDVLLSHVITPPEPLPPSVPAQIAAVLMKLLEKKPSRRHPDAGSLRTALLVASHALGIDPLAPETAADTLDDPGPRVDATILEEAPAGAAMVGEDMSATLIAPSPVAEVPSEPVAAKEEPAPVVEPAIPEEPANPASPASPPAGLHPAVRAALAADPMLPYRKTDPNERDAAAMSSQMVTTITGVDLAIARLTRPRLWILAAIVCAAAIVVAWLILR
jgi:serine/threonine-protein kinase